jgi:hypothetical protein
VQEKSLPQSCLPIFFKTNKTNIFLQIANEDISHNDQSPPQVKILSEQNPISIISGMFLKI